MNQFMETAGRHYVRILCSPLSRAEAIAAELGLTMVQMALAWCCGGAKWHRDHRRVASRADRDNVRAVGVTCLRRRLNGSIRRLTGCRAVVVSFFDTHFLALASGFGVGIGVALPAWFGRDRRSPFDGDFKGARAVRNSAIDADIIAIGPRLRGTGGHSHSHSWSA